jgi:hypothetical protein
VRTFPAASAILAISFTFTRFRLARLEAVLVAIRALRREPEGGSGLHRHGEVWVGRFQTSTLYGFDLSPPACAMNVILSRLPAASGFAV